MLVEGPPGCGSVQDPIHVNSSDAEDRSNTVSTLSVEEADSTTEWPREIPNALEVMRRACLAG